MLKDRRTYVCDAVEVARNRVSFTGRLRTRNVSGDVYGPTVEHTLTLGQVRCIYWHREREGGARC